MIPTVLNFVAFQTCWLANVLGAANGYPSIGPLFTVVWLTVHIMKTSRTRRASEFALIICAGMAGYFADSVLVWLDLLVFPATTMLGAPSPIWMVCLWMGFAATLRSSMKWLHERHIVAAVFGAIGGPMAYFAGAELNAVILPQFPASLLGVSLIWLFMTPVLVRLAETLEQHITAAKAVFKQEPIL